MSEITIESINLEDIILIHDCLLNCTFQVKDYSKLQEVIKIIQKLEDAITEISL
jgi:hypothetical protein